MAKKAQKKQEALDTITEIELISIETARLQLADARAKVKQLEADLKLREHDVIERLSKGAQVVGRFMALLKKVKGACRPEWKALYLEHMESHGIPKEKAEADVKAGTPVEERTTLVIAPKSPEEK